MLALPLGHPCSRQRRRLPFVLTFVALTGACATVADVDEEPVLSSSPPSAGEPGEAADGPEAPAFEHDGADEPDRVNLRDGSSERDAADAESGRRRDGGSTGEGSTDAGADTSVDGAGVVREAGPDVDPRGDAMADTGAEANVPDGGSSGSSTTSCQPIAANCVDGRLLEFCITYTQATCSSVEYRYRGNSFSCSSCSNCSDAYGRAYTVCQDAVGKCGDLAACCRAMDSTYRPSCDQALQSVRNQSMADISCKAILDSYERSNLCP